MKKLNTKQLSKNLQALKAKVNWRLIISILIIIAVLFLLLPARMPSLPVFEKSEPVIGVDCVPMPNCYYCSTQCNPMTKDVICRHCAESCLPDK